MTRHFLGTWRNGARRGESESVKKRTSYNFAQNANLNSFQLLLLLFYLHFGANTRRLLPRPQNKRQAGTYVSSRFLLGIPNRHFSAPEKLHFPRPYPFQFVAGFLYATSSWRPFYSLLYWRKIFKYFMIFVGVSPLTTFPQSAGRNFQFTTKWIFIDTKQ